ncbi:methionyl-tRNA formyltransferase [Sphingomonas sp. H39-1-10]|uniref:methionyl-tRNA formyltransferase n=1 Tax=Sphingomonas pollutisoli TaxID=3030829 RepID=UPI0023B9292D|nr:methionyl-tRNA formyltransferase [Sphingomonas pollutisoli]MDF0489549.1 methionyl-tRNA formyltransferase [Sphingomonas pollutisoli]
MRIIFMGTPDFSVPVLRAIVDAGHQVVAVYSQPPRRAGRGKALTPTPVARAAETLGIAVRTPVSLRDAEAQTAFAALDADVAVVAAYGLILPRAVLDAPRGGCLNVHASLLPRWRGAAPIQRAILAGDAETGVCIMQMEAGLDTGPVRLEDRTPIADKTAGVLTDELSAMGARLMVTVLADINAYPAVPQPEQGVTYAAKIDKAETRIDWSQSAEQVERQVRAFNPVPGAWFEMAGERVKVLACQVLRPGEGREHLENSAPADASGPGLRRGDGVVLDAALTIACGSGAIRPTLLQRAGRGVVTADELLRGFPIPAGTHL